jgi:hypothetical protein
VLSVLGQWIAARFAQQSPGRPRAHVIIALRRLFST